jgi:hypothetical protein
VAGQETPKAHRTPYSSKEGEDALDDGLVAERELYPKAMLNDLNALPLARGPGDVLMELSRSAMDENASRIATSLLLEVG